MAIYINGQLPSSDGGTPITEGPVVSVNNKQGTVVLEPADIGAEPTITNLSIAKGGTGKTTAAEALKALLPDQTDKEDKVLMSHGTNYAPTWETVSNAVSSVNGKTGTVVLDNTDVGAAASNHNHTGTYEPAITTLSVAKGGTGKTTAAEAITNLLPDQTDNSGKALVTNGTTASWQYVSSGGAVSSVNGYTGVVSLGYADVGASSSSHNHSGTYEPADSAIQTHLGLTNNPHAVTKTQVGLSNVTNIAQLGKATSSTDNAIVRFDGTTGDASQNSLATIDDSGSINIPLGQTYKINTSPLSYSDVGAAASNHNHTGTYEPAITTLSIDKGGTGQTTANSALNALLPDQTSANGKVLTSNGTSTSWQLVGSGGGDITSVNGYTGVVVLESDDISDTDNTNKFVTSTEKTAITHSNRTYLDKIGETSTHPTYDSNRLALYSEISSSIPYGKNWIMNGNFSVAQRVPIPGTIIANPANYTYPICDRWKILYTADGGTMPTTINHTRYESDPSVYDNIVYQYRIAPNGAGSNLGASSYYRLQQGIENGTRLLCGANKTVTIALSAWEGSLTNKKLCVALLQDYGTGGSPSATELIAGTTFTLTSSLTTFTHTFTTNTLSGKTFGTNNDDALYVLIYYQWGSNLCSQIGASSVEDYGGNGLVDLFRVELYQGSSVLTYQPLSFDQILRDCKRYYQKSCPYSVAPADGVATDEYRYGVVETTGILGLNVTFEKELRTAATSSNFTFYRDSQITGTNIWGFWKTSGSWTAATSMTFQSGNTKHAYVKLNKSSGFTVNNSYYITGAYTVNADF